ncbi:myb-like protein X [Chironomus tepperi]|uniref:myb-like protein X n=1 Tax=Chironomus tepperi TaxID=113505 RepID=UPI00391FBD53
MNKTAETTFVPLAYFKKLTHCLANRRNTKVNVSKIQGVRDYHFKTMPLITNRKVQIKFLANHRLRKEFNENQKQQREKFYNNSRVFTVKNNVAINEKLKRKTKEESYINLSDSYFKSVKLPDILMFKVPEVPPIKKQKIQILPKTVNVSNFTLSSLFSGDFNPPRYSTPVEKDQNNNTYQLPPLIAVPTKYSTPIEQEKDNKDDQGMDKKAKQQRNDKIADQQEKDKKADQQDKDKKADQQVKDKKEHQLHPLIVDPNDILGPYNNSQFLEEMKQERERKERIMAAREVDKLKAYKNLIDNAASYVESVCFAEITDSIMSIVNRLYEKHEEATQTPRPSLVSSKSYSNLVRVFSQTPQDPQKTSLWPVPVFYDQPNEEIVNDFSYDNDDDINPLFDNPNTLFYFLNEDNSINIGTDDIKSDESPTTSQTSFFNQTSNPSSTTSLSSNQSSLIPYPISNCDDELELFEQKFSTSLEINWKLGNDCNTKDSDISAIFRSPPKTNKLESKRKSIDTNWDTDLNLSGEIFNPDISDFFSSPQKTKNSESNETFSRIISRPKRYNTSNSDVLSDKDDQFTVWFSDNNNNNSTPDKAFMYNDTQSLFETKYSLF